MEHDERISAAKLKWRTLRQAGSAPYSVTFDDIYFAEDGPAETEHVFLEGNNLRSRFSDAKRFTIGELGFGTGLNFLCAWRAWAESPKQPDARLRFFSVEAYPLSIEDMARAHESWPELRDYATTLRAALPPTQSGFHHVQLSADVALTLYYGTALDGLRKTEADIDAWFLDGFSPAKNPEMWAPDLFKEAARLSNEDAAFSTFTVAGPVRRALQDAGFSIEKRPGFGKKREMLAGRLERKPLQTSRRKPWFDTRPTRPLGPGATVAIVGAGVAGASLAYALKRAGLEPTVYEENEPASGASGNPAGLIMPRVDVDDTPAGRFHVQAYLHVVQLLNRLQANADETLFKPCGVLLHAKDEKERNRQKKLIEKNALPEAWIQPHKDGLFFPQAGVASPPDIVRALLSDTPLECDRVLRLINRNGVWSVLTAKREETFDAVIIANGLDALRFEPMRSVPLSGSAGQVDYFPNAAPPPHAHAFGPYAAPAPGGGLVIGATYAPIAIGAEAAFTAEATRSNINAVSTVLPEIGKLSSEASQPRASVRCVTPDRLPIVGPIPDWGFYGGAYDGLRDGKKRDYPPGETQTGLYALTGLGSRGLVTAPWPPRSSLLK